MAIFPSFQSQADNFSNGASTITTANLTVAPGCEVYVQVAMYGSGLTTPGVTDTESGQYYLLNGGNNGSIYLWVFRRHAPVPVSSSSFQVTAMPSSSSDPIVIMAVAVASDAGIDNLSSVHTGTASNPETSSVSTLSVNDLVLFFGADNHGAFSSYGSGQTGLTYTGAPSNVQAWGSYQAQAGVPATANSTRNLSGTATWVAISIAIFPSIPWTGVVGRPFVTVSPIGTGTTPATPLPNNGADFGPDSAGTLTSGIQEALNSIAATGGTVYCYQGVYELSLAIAFTGSYQLLEFAAGSAIVFANGLGGIQPSWTHTVTYELAYCLILMGGPAVSSTPAPFSHQWFVGNGVQINWGSNATLDGFQIVSPGPQAVNGYTGPGGEDFLIEGIVSTGYIGECFSVHSQYQDSPNVISQMTRHIVVRRFFDTRAAVTTGGSGFSVGGNVFDMLIEDVEIDLSQATGPLGMSNCFIGGWQGGTYCVTVRRCRFISDGGLSGQPLGSQVLELQGNALNGTTTNGCTDITIEDTLFDSGASSGAPAAGYGGAYIDDNDRGTGVGSINRVTFRNCQWRFCGMTLQSSGSTAGYIVFEGNLPGEFYDGPMGGRPILQGPNLNASGQFASILRTYLPSAAALTIAEYQPPTGIVGQYRVSIYVAAVAADTATITIQWTDPDVGAQNIVVFSTSLAIDKSTSAVTTLVASSASTITVYGKATSSSSSLLASATIDQVG